MRFEVLSDSTIIGYTDLEFGDPPMGVAHGKFFPIATYETIKSEIIATRETASPHHLLLTIRLVDGETLDSVIIKIEDFFEEFGELSIEVYMISSSLYQRLFPAHVLAYENQFHK